MEVANHNMVYFKPAVIVEEIREFGCEVLCKMWISYVEFEVQAGEMLENGSNCNCIYCNLSIPIVLLFFEYFRTSLL